MRGLAGFLRRAVQEERIAKKEQQPSEPPKARFVRRKGPFTAAMAEREIASAITTDAILDILFAFVGQFFEYAALFVVRGDLAEGRDASGPGADRARLGGIGVPLDMPGVLSLARERRAPVVARLERDLDAELARDLGRGPRDPARAAVVFPVIVRARSVAMIYGDDGESDVELSTLGDVISFVSLAGAALEQIALRKKRGGSKHPSAPPPRARIAAMPVSARGGGVAALARALALPGQGDGATPNPAETTEIHGGTPPAPRVSPGAESVRTTDYVAAQAAAESSFAASSIDGSLPSEGLPPVDILRGQPTMLRFGQTKPLGSRAATSEIVDEDSGDNLHKALSKLAVDAHADAPVNVTMPQGPALDRAELEAHAYAQVRRATAPYSAGQTRHATTPGLQPVMMMPVAGDLAFEPDDSPPMPKHEVLPVPPLVEARPVTSRPIPREEDDIGSAFISALDRSPPPLPPPPPSESTGVIHARPMESARTPIPQVPSVIVDVGAEYASLLQRFMDGGPHAHDAFAELVRNGEHAAPFLMARFPGPLRVDRHRARDQLPAASQCGPVLELVVAIRRAALPFVTAKIASPDLDVRFWATHVLGELRYPEAANVLIPRLFDDDVSIRRVARRSAAALVGAGSAGTPLLQGLDHLTRNPDQPIPHRVLAIETMGEIRTGAFVPPLVAVLNDPSDDVSDAARRALLLIARQDFGKDPRRWKEWWRDHGLENRVEWLIDALMHEQPAIRRAAGDELKHLTKEYFGYYDDLPKKDRERAQGLYRAWWLKEGRLRFG